MEHSDFPLIAGVFREQTQADHAISALEQAGFSKEMITSTAYNFHAVQDTQDTQDTQSAIGSLTDNNRIVVTVVAEGRDQEAVGILISNGANNSDIPSGTALVNGAITGADAETDIASSEQQVGAVPDSASNSSFSRQEITEQPEDPDARNMLP